MESVELVWAGDKRVRGGTVNSQEKSRQFGVEYEEDSVGERSGYLVDAQVVGFDIAYFMPHWNLKFADDAYDVLGEVPLFILPVCRISATLLSKSSDTHFALSLISQWARPSSMTTPNRPSSSRSRASELKDSKEL
jgi:hypothetical protein